MEGLSATTEPFKPGFVGRDAELALLRSRLADVLTGRGRMVLISGEAGIGKTRVAEEFASVAQQQGALVLWGRSYEGSGAPAFWPWVQLLRAYLRTQNPAAFQDVLGMGVADIVQLVPELRAQLNDVPEVPLLEPDQARFRLFDALTSVFIQAARRQALVLILDDLHWADMPSALALQFLARELGDARLLVVGAYRHEEVGRGHPLAPAVSMLARETTVERIPLGGLSESDLSRLITQVAGRSADHGLAVAIHRQTEGNPFFASEIVRLLASDRSGDFSVQPTGRIPIPATVRETVGQRLDRLSRDCQSLLTVAAVIGREFGLGLLQRASELPTDKVLELVAEAERARIVSPAVDVPGEYRFAHALVHESLYEEIPTVGRARLHRQVGEVLEPLAAASPERYLTELVHHFFLAAPGGDVAKATAFARRAGDYAMTLFAYEDAVAHYTRAVHLLERKYELGGSLQPTGSGTLDAIAEDQSLVCELLLGLGEAQRAAGFADSARQTFERAVVIARRLRAPELRALAVLGASGDRSPTGHSDVMLVNELEEALDALPEQPSATRALLMARLARELYRSDQQERAVRLGHHALAMAHDLGDRRVMMHVLRFEAFALQAGGLEERLVIADRIVQLAGAPEAAALALSGHAWRLTCLLELGDVAGADQALAAHQRLAEQLRQPIFLAQATAFRAMRALLDGRFAEAEQLAQAALQLGQWREPDAFQAFGAQLFMLRSQQGRLAELEDAVKGFIAQYPAMPAWRCALAYLYSELDRDSEARAEFERLAAHGFADLPRDILWTAALTSLTEVCAFLGDSERGALLYDLLLPYAGRSVVVGVGYACNGAIARSLGILAGTMHRWNDAEAHFEMAVAMNLRMGAHAWLARTRCDYAGMLLDRGTASDVLRAGEVLAAALTAAQELGMSRLVGQVQAHLGRITEWQASMFVAPQEHTMAPYPDGLTAREVEVLVHIAAGRLSREMAAELSISVTTVERHIANLYAKIGARNRADATAYAIYHRLAPPRDD